MQYKHILYNLDYTWHATETIQHMLTVYTFKQLCDHIQLEQHTNTTTCKWQRSTTELHANSTHAKSICHHTHNVTIYMHTKYWSYRINVYQNISYCT